MQITTKTTVMLSGTEIREIIASHLREKDALPPGGKFTVTAHVPDTANGTHERIEVKDQGDLRITVEWPAPTNPNVVAKIGSGG